VRTDLDAVRPRSCVAARVRLLALLCIGAGGAAAASGDAAPPGGEREAAAVNRPAAATVAGNAAAGQGRFGLCESCHGVRAEGNAGLGAPAIAGLQDWYVTRQLENFRENRRGTAPDDARGQQMRAMAQTLESDAAVADIVAYLATLKPVVSGATIEGDVAHGKELYATCMSCHGDRAQGNDSVQAPALSYSNDWYLLRQLENFHTGRRGTSDANTFGGQMRAMASTLPDEAAWRDVVAYIATLGAR
jgi:cytochrome c oxidase subunit II